MKWRGRRASTNIEDRRGSGRARMPAPMRGKGGKISIGTVVLALAAMYFFNVDPSIILQGGLTDLQMPSPAGQQGGKTNTAQNDKLKEFIAVVLADTEDSWNKIFPTIGKKYAEPKLVIFSGAVNSACGFAQAAMGPFYCPGDHKVYIDLSFYHDLRNRHGAAGDFAQAYVIAHEVGHHVQSLLGISSKVHQLQRSMSKVEGNRLSVKLELQADCFAGIWANYARKFMERGDIEEALRAASAIGDDTLQKKAQGHVVPDAFTHGSSAQRKRWFQQGFNSGDISSCDTFSTSSL